MRSGLKDKKLRQRLRIFYVVVLITLLIISGRLWNLQIRQGEHYAHLADGNRIRRIRVMPTRGVIMDRNHQELIRSRPAFAVSLIPGGIPQDSDAAMVYLSNILELSDEELAEAIDRGRSSRYEPVRIMRDVDPAVVVAIEENRVRLPGVMIEEEWVREYLYGDLTSHLTGYLGIISRDELQKFGESYSSSDLVGKTGLEAEYETLLRGTAGSLTVEVNALSRPIQTVSHVDSIPGYNLVMTIDKDLQAAAKAGFVNHTKTLREEGQPPFAGSVVALNPKTGELLAMVSFPDYDASYLLDDNQRNAYYASLSNDNARPLFNRSVQGQYGPGSVFKPFIAVALLEEEIITSNQVFNATGTSRYGVRDWVIAQGGTPFGNITLTEAMAMSSNHYFVHFGTELGIDRLAPWLRDFGFGEHTGLVGVGQEAGGIVPDRQWKRERFSHLPTYDQAWYPSDTEQVSIGQGFITVTPLQLAIAYGAIANRGVVYQPTLVNKLIDPEGNVIDEHVPVPNKILDVSDQTWDAVINGMQAVITHPRGTARSAFVDFPLTVAGKTGSYEIPGQEAHGLFGAFAPADDPELVVVVLVEHGVGGGSSAAPIARRVFDAYFGFDKEESPE